VVKVLGKEKSLKAGHYQLDRAVSIRQLADMISEGDVVLKSVTVIEGWTFKQMRTALNQHPDVQHDTTPLSDTQILARLEVNHSSAEGLFFPDTYHFSSGMSDLAIFRQAHQLMKDQLERAWEQRVQDLPLKNPYQALILASIVEKETGLAAERPLIAAVFINRLKRGMMLQTDPTVIYGLGVAFDGNLRRKDLVMDGPYNTYTRAGLPPTPICLPGGESLYAALHPAPSQALYFVSKGDGSHYFSETLSEHGQAVNRYQLN
jgi:UPF0755 protein